MDSYSPQDREKALAPLRSLISKSEKAQQKLAPGTLQHAMLRDNLKALRIALALLTHETETSDRFTAEDLRQALMALAAMIRRTEQAQGKFAPCTSQHSLLRNRLKALRIANDMVQAELEKG